MHPPKIKLRKHTYQHTTEIKIQVINNKCKDAMGQFKPGLLRITTGILARIVVRIIKESWQESW